ncbi:MAG: hypothetical protein ACJ75B_10740 [Flavisolibacter sp.]
MKSFFLFIVWLPFDCCYGQTAVSIGANTGMVTRLHGLTAGIGGSVELVTRFSEHAGARFYAGYDYFKAKGPNSYIAFLPIRAGIQGILSDIFFLYGEAGVAQYYSPNEKLSGFSFNLGGGYQVPFGLRRQFIQISAFYNSMFYKKNYSWAWLNLRVAYGFGLGKPGKNSG